MIGSSTCKTFSTGILSTALGAAEAVLFLAGFSGGAEPPCSTRKPITPTKLTLKQGLQKRSNSLYLIFANLILIEQLPGSIAVAYLLKAFCGILTCDVEDVQGFAGDKMTTISF